MAKSISYDFDKVFISACDLKGAMIERVHGKQARIKPRFYRVRDNNLKTRGEWIVQLHEKKIEEKSGGKHHAKTEMVLLTRQSIMIQEGKIGKYKGKPYAHITFRKPGQRGGKKTAGRGQKDELPRWFMDRYKRKMKLRSTVQGKVTSEFEAGKRLGKFHDIKQVVVFKDWDDEELIRYFFIMRVFSVEQGYELSS